MKTEMPPHMSICMWASVPKCLPCPSYFLNCSHKHEILDNVESEDELKVATWANRYYSPIKGQTFSNPNNLWGTNCYMELFRALCRNIITEPLLNDDSVNCQNFCYIGTTYFLLGCLRMKQPTAHSLHRRTVVTCETIKLIISFPLL